MTDETGDNGDPAPRPAEPGGLRERHILVADDVDLNREVVVRILQREGARVTACEDGLALLERISAGGEPVHAVLVDVQMPNMDGLAATRALRSRDATARLPIVGLTAGDSARELADARAARMDDVLIKPFTPAQLVACVSGLIARHAAAPERPPPVAADWPHIDGIDAASAHRRLAGDVELLRSVLSRLLDETRTFEPPTRMAPDDCLSWAGRLHAIKGAAATLGAVAVSEQAAAAEAACRALQTERALADIAALNTALQRLAEAATGFLTAPARDAEAAAHRPGTPALDCDALLVLLAQRDLAALDWFKDNADGLRALLGKPEYLRLRSALYALEFDQVASALRVRCGHSPPFPPTADR